MSRHSFKIVLLGEGRVGKTSLVLRYANNVFSDKQRSTIQASLLSKRLTINDTTVNLAIWVSASLRIPYLSLRLMLLFFLQIRRIQQDKNVFTPLDLFTIVMQTVRMMGGKENWR